MRTNKNLAKYFAVVAAVTTLCGTSAFAETRHHDETRGDGGRGDRSGRVERSNHDQRSNDSQRSNENGNRDRANSQRSNQNWNRDQANNERSNENWNRDQANNERSNENRNRDQANNERSRENWNRDRANSQRSNENWNRDRVNNDRSYDNRGRNDNYNNRGRNDNYNNRGRGDSYRGGRNPYYYNGRIERYERWNNGFRIYLGGAPYPFFVPEAYFRSHGFRLGLSIRLGGYYNPLGYYDYYDAPYDGYYDGYSSPAYAAGELRGIVESVDYRRGTVLVRDTASDRIVNAVMRGDDPRFGDLRIGDYVELSGDWTRIGTFDSLNSLVSGSGRHLLFATNAGIFDPTFTPCGLLVQDGFDATNDRRAGVMKQPDARPSGHGPAR